MTSELKPCPFCGGEARFARGFDYGEIGCIRWVYCSKCGAMTRSDFHATESDAAKAWNRRVFDVTEEDNGHGWHYVVTEGTVKE